MKTLLLLFLLLSCKITFSQDEMFIPEMEIKATDKNVRYSKDEILKSITQTNRNGKSLKIVKYPDMSYCGGSLRAYYDKGELKIIESVYGAEFGFQGLTAYFKDSSIVKIIRKEVKPDYDEYKRKYPKAKEIDPKLLKYTSFEVTVLLTQIPLITCKIDGNTVQNSYKNKDLKRDLECIRSMMLELQTVTER